MSNSQEQSLNENAVFQRVNESSPEFLYCEKERQAMEKLLSAGPEAFYSSIGTDRSGCFLSPKEVSQIASWAQDYHFNRPQVQSEANGEEGSPETEDFCSTYFPAHSDTPAPDLELGWPDKDPWVPKGSITVHTSPPAEGEPPVREIIRRHLQKARQVIAIVTDRLTDGAIIGDLHTAASRGVPVYIILNQRTIQENFTINRLKHPNMRVRVLGGKTFCSRMGRMVGGEMKDKFLLVDLQTAIHGSYSLTWTDAHLHRQLITVLSGPVVDSFDREFRILFAASLPVSDTWSVADTHVDVTLPLKDPSNHRFQKHLPLEPEITSPPSPPADNYLDWKAMGVGQRDLNFPDSPHDQHEGIVSKEMPLQNNRLFDKNTHMDGFTNNGNQFVDRGRLIENASPVTNSVPYKTTTFNSSQPSPTDLTSPESYKSVERILEKAYNRQLSIEKSFNLDERITTRVLDKATEQTHDAVQLSSAKRGEYSRRESTVEDERSLNEICSKVQNTPSSRKPLILRVPQADGFSSLSDLIKRFQPQRSSSGLLKRGPRATMSEMSQSMMDLSVHGKDTNDVPVPRFMASCFDPGHITPAFALMKKRSDEVKPLLYRTPKNFLPRERPRSSSFALGVDWRMSMAEIAGNKERGAKK